MLADVVNHVWQSTLVLAAIAALAALLRGHGAHVRFWLWWAASVKFLVPFSLLTLLGSAVAGTAAPIFEIEAVPYALGLLAEPMPETASSTPLALAFLGVWACGFVAVAAARGRRALQIRACVRASSPYAAALPRAGTLEVRTSRGRVEPALVGIVRPVLLLPVGIAEHLTPSQLAAVLEHEVEHQRRRDNLTAAVHMLVEAVFWFHPLVWWLGARLVEERERACDEAVVRAGHDGRTYAEAILNVCEHYVASTLECAAGVSGADLKQRVMEIARSKVMSDLPIRNKILLGTAAFAAVVAPMIFGAVGGRAVAEDAVVPLVRVQPEYPPEAIAAGLEGMVQLQFTIAPNGATQDIVVVESSAPVFEAPAMAAVGSWRYAPPTQNGNVAERRGVHTIIRFALQADAAQ